MEHVLFLLFVSPVFLQAQGPLPEEITAFHYHLFQENYILRDVLIRALGQRQVLLPKQIKEVQVVAKDLYEESELRYTYNRKVEGWVQAKYSMTEKEKIEQLKAVPRLRSEQAISPPVGPKGR